MTVRCPKQWHEYFLMAIVSACLFSNATFGQTLKSPAQSSKSRVRLSPQAKAAASNAVKVLNRMAAATEIGTNYQGYTERLIDLKVEIDEALELIPGSPDIDALGVKLGQLNGRLNSLRERRETLASRFTADWPEIKRIDTVIADIETLTPNLEHELAKRMVTLSADVVNAVPLRLQMLLALDTYLAAKRQWSLFIEKPKATALEESLSNDPRLIELFGKPLSQNDILNKMWQQAKNHINQARSLLAMM